MSDDEGTNGSNAELESLKQKLSDTEKRFNDAEEKLNTSQTLLANAIAALAGAGGGGLPAVPAPVAARKTPAEILREKISLLHQLLTKSP